MRKFDPSATEYDLNNALWFARASQLAYEDGGTIQSTASEWGVSRCRFISKQHLELDTQAFVAEGDGFLLVAFRGTADFRDWITDAMMAQDAGPYGEVHHGFLNAYRIVQADIESTLAEFGDDGSRPVWITGHSLGGALAAVCAAFRLKAGASLAGLYTYGQPRTGDSDFAEALREQIGERTFRHVNDRDIVPRVPPRIHLGGENYSHFGEVRFFDAEGHLHDSINRWHEFLEAVRIAFTDAPELLTSRIEDHKIAHYVELVEAAAATD